MPTLLLRLTAVIPTRASQIENLALPVQTRADHLTDKHRMVTVRHRTFHITQGILDDQKTRLGKYILCNPIALIDIAAPVWIKTSVSLKTVFRLDSMLIESILRDVLTKSVFAMVAHCIDL